MIKKILLLFFIFCMVNMADAQSLKVPELSPSAMVEQMIGLTKVRLDYSRPSARDRKIFGDLVPYGQLWRTGANLNTTFTFDTDVRMSSIDLKKGAYALFTIPDDGLWEVILYDHPRGYMPGKLDEEKVLHRFKVKANANRYFVESFTIEFSDIKTSSANIVIKWADRSIEIPLEVPGDEMAMENIKNLVAGPSADDLFGAAEYYFANNKDLDQALTWVRASVDKYTWDAYWPSYLEAQILAKLNRKAEAIAAGERASKYVKKAGYDVIGVQIDTRIQDWKNSK